jgi:hypothetical protein
VVALAPGTRRLSVLTRRPFDGPRHVREMRELLGAEWTYMDRVNKLGLLGCLPMLVTGVTLLFMRWDWLWLLVPVMLLSWLPYFVLKSGRRFKAAEQRAAERERAMAHYVIVLEETQDQALAGGFMRV